MMHVPFDLASRLRYLEQEFTDAEYDRRLAGVRANMECDGLDALVIYCGPASYANARWLTNYQAFYGSCFMVIRADGDMTVTTDGVLHGEPMHTMVLTCRTEDLRCAGSLHAALVDRLPDLRPLDSAVADARMIKGSEEITRMEEAGR